MVIRLDCLHIIIYKLLSLQQKHEKMTAETIQLIQTGINLLCASGVISTLLYYNSRKRYFILLGGSQIPPIRPLSCPMTKIWVPGLDKMIT